MKTVLVFKTSVEGESHLRLLSPLLNELINSFGRWNFDLEDCDNILRVETHNPNAVEISFLLQKHGFFCEELL